MWSQKPLFRLLTNTYTDRWIDTLKTISLPAVAIAAVKWRHNKTQISFRHRNVGVFVFARNIEVHGWYIMVAFNWPGVK